MKIVLEGKKPLSAWDERELKKTFKSVFYGNGLKYVFMCDKDEK